MGVVQLAHVELLCPKLEESHRFFTDVLGLHERLQHGGEVFLRGWGDWFHHTISLKEGATPGIGHTAWQVAEEQDLDHLGERLRAAGVETWWVEDEPGQGPGLRFHDPAGHVHELVYELERTPGDAVESRLHNQPLRIRGRGIEPRRLDHVNLLAPDVGAISGFLQDALGFHLREKVSNPTGESGHWLSVTGQVHDIASMWDPEGFGRLHHVAFWLDSRELVMRAADLLVENDAHIEAGPGKHGITQAFFLYFFEPSGNRLELFSNGYYIFDPHWQPIVWGTPDKDRVEIALTGFKVRDFVAGSARPVEV